MSPKDQLDDLDEAYGGRALTQAERAQQLMASMPPPPVVKTAMVSTDGQPVFDPMSAILDLLEGVRKVAQASVSAAPLAPAAKSWGELRTTIDGHLRAAGIEPAPSSGARRQVPTPHAHPGTRATGGPGMTAAKLASNKPKGRG